MSDERKPAESTATDATENVEAAEPAGTAVRAPGAPVEEDAASRTEVLRAVERSREAGETAVVLPADADAADADANVAGGGAAIGGERGVAASPDASRAGSGAASDTDAATIAAEAEHRREVSEVDTQLDLEPVVAPKGKSRKVPPTTLDDLPSAAAEPAADPLTRGDEIRISADHPMAALYMQSPMPPEIRGNRGAGTLISLLATLGFAAVLAGVIALWLAPQYPPSTFLEKGLLPIVTSLGFIAAVAAFLLAMVVLVLVVGRAGWWAYVLGGFLVAVAVWGATVVGLAMHDRFILGITTSLQPLQMIAKYGLTLPAIAAAIVAREASVWFGAWIGSRGRRMKLRNAEALAEYDEALAEAQAKQS
ncbi:hypothetical protein JD292_00995 [Leucobacter sp. CSA2]|uniref:Uncharacterized protein n=1 Tax=Leucobacter edaphi TaxID=2796472 RepID=A0A934QA02_9MICO|nr:hypothetical protein [Leucobacter edaphi]MBK0420656.1 hypothetical protein [Leucobacter edaphi]